MDKSADNRDLNGRFATGNGGGPGRPRGRGYDLQRAAQEAITPEHMSAMMKRALRMALEGNLQAMRFVAERTIGRAPEAVGQPVEVALPAMRDAGGCSKAIDRLVDAVAAGTIDLAAAKVMLDLVQARLKAIEVTDVEVRLAELEKAAAAVDLGGGR